jgi:SAM-dependent methyltransferase
MTERAPQHPGGAYYASIAQRLGEAYLALGFTQGTSQETDFLIELLGLRPGQRLLDVGCGPGRHAVELALRGVAVTGVDVSRRFLDIAAQRARRAAVRASFFEVDARQMPFDDEFDAVISICQGAFGLMGPDDSVVLRRIAEALIPGGRLALTALNALHTAANVGPEASLDADAGVLHEPHEVTVEDGSSERVETWTGVYTPRELRLLSIGVGLVPEAVFSVGPGDFARRRPSPSSPEFMLVARRPVPDRRWRS